jgi:2-dehydro-3-deoxyphosphooctonate aldolase (KDO 8-P synthase)
LNKIIIPKLTHADSNNFFLLAGPCVVESKENLFEIASHLSQICNDLKIPLVLKASYKKANRSKLNSFTGIGNEKALEILALAGEQYGLPTVTDIHTEQEASLAAKYVDVLQIPAFLCRQTDLLLAAGETGKWVNIKKGQFVSAYSMKFAVEKVKQAGNNNIMLTERGTTFGYHDLIVDYRNIPDMQKHDVPVVLDVTHSLQQPNQESGVTGGRPDLIPTIAAAGIAAGVNGLFIETHPDPKNAKSDGANMLSLALMEPLLKKLLKIHQAMI